MIYLWTGALCNLVTLITLYLDHGPIPLSQTMLVDGHSPFVQSKNSIGSLCEGALAMTPHSYVTVVKHASCHEELRRHLALGQAQCKYFLSGTCVRCDSEYLSSDPRAIWFVCGHFFLRVSLSVIDILDILLHDPYP